MVAGTLLPVGVGAEELPVDINNEEITVADVMMYEDTDMSEDEEENEAAAETEEVIDVVSEENSEEAPAETSEPEAAEPETTESEVSESEVSEPEVTEPVETEPETTEPEVTEPEVPDFEETEPDEIITEEELPADAPEEEIYFCGIEEHEHTEECRNAPEEPDGEIIVEEEIPEEEPQPEEEPGELYCGYEVHVHDDTCWNEEYLADCGMEEHEHSENCYSLAYTLMTEFAAAVELFPDEADYILLDFDEADGSELLDEEAYYRAYAAFYEENPDIWMTTDALFAEAEAAYAEENPDGDIDAWMQDNGFWKAAEKFYWVVPTPDAVAEKTAQMEETEEIEMEITMEEDGMMLYGNTPSEVPNNVTLNATVKVFNYTETVNTTGLGEKGYSFFQGDYTDDAKEGSIDGVYAGTAGVYNINNHPILKKTLVNGYPYVEGKNTTLDKEAADIEGSMDYLFSDTIQGSYHKGTMTNGGGLFQKPTEGEDAGYYVYDSAKNSAYFDGKSFKLYDTVVRPNYSAIDGSDVQRSNFLPFNQVANKVTVDTTLSTGVQAAKLNEPVDLWFGMTVEFDFFMPKDGQMNGNDMIFDFRGDDDVFVYIDDVLVVNLIGTHAAETATINFADGTVTQNRTGTKNIDGNVVGPINSTLKKCFEEAGEIGTFDGDTFADYTKHTLKFFYMERGGNISYCRLRFNMPILPKNSLMVGKELVVDNPAGEDVTEYVSELSKSLSYEFAVWKTDKDGNILEDDDGNKTLLVQPGDKFKIQENGDDVGEGTVGGEGYFTLKAGQSALFEELLKKYRGEYYIVEERIPAAFKAQYGDVLITGSEDVVIKDAAGDDLYYGYYTDVQETDSETISMVNIFNNPIKVDMLSTFAVEKVIAEGSKFENEEFKFEIKFGGELLKNTAFELEGGTEISTDKDGILTLKAGQRATLTTQVISGTVYEVREILGSDDKTTLVFYDAANVAENAVKEHKFSSTPRTKENLNADHGISGAFDVGSEIVVTVTNSTYDVDETYDLLVTKKITGNMGDINREFKFEAFITKYEEEPVLYSEAPVLLMSSADDIPAGDIGSVEEKLEFTLGHNDSYKIVGIPKGYVVTISELDAEGYDTTIVWDEMEETYGENEDIRSLTTGKITESGGKVIFTNDKTATIDTAVHLDYLPYILILTAVIPTMTLAVSRKRRRTDED